MFFLMLSSQLSHLFITTPHSAIISSSVITHCYSTALVPGSTMTDKVWSNESTHVATPQWHSWKHFLTYTSLGNHRWQQSQPIFKKTTNSTKHLLLVTVFPNMCKPPENEIHTSFPWSALFMTFPQCGPKDLPSLLQDTHILLFQEGLNWLSFWQFHCLPWWQHYTKLLSDSYL